MTLTIAKKDKLIEAASKYICFKIDFDVDDSLEEIMQDLKKHIETGLQDLKKEMDAKKRMKMRLIEFKKMINAFAHQKFFIARKATKLFTASFKDLWTSPNEADYEKYYDKNYSFKDVDLTGWDMDLYLTGSVIGVWDKIKYMRFDLENMISFCDAADKEIYSKEMLTYNEYYRQLCAEAEEIYRQLCAEAEEIRQAQIAEKEEEENDCWFTCHFKKEEEESLRSMIMRQQGYAKKAMKAMNIIRNPMTMQKQ